jgi:hypothetical protein
MKVLTTHGEIEFDQLEVKDLIEVKDNHRKIATEYRLSGELVRRDVVVNLMMPLCAVSEQGRVGG